MLQIQIFISWIAEVFEERNRLKIGGKMCNLWNKIFASKKGKANIFLKKKISNIGEGTKKKRSWYFISAFKAIISCQYTPRRTSTIFIALFFRFLAQHLFDMKIVVILFPKKIHIPSLLLTRDFRTKQWSNRLSVSKWITLLPQERSFIVIIILQSVYTYNSKHVIFSTLKMQVAPQK